MNQTETLLICTEEACQTRIFKEEVRAQLDAKSLIDTSIALPMLTDTQMPIIIDKMLEELEKEKSKIDRDAVKKDLFAINGNSNMGIRFRRRIQQYSKTDFYDVNQCWMVLFSESDHIRKRLVVIATLKEATNMGDEIEEMRIIVLVIAPRIEKETKSAKETAQTIASLLTRDEARLRILESRTAEGIRDVLKREADWHMNKNEWRIEIETAHHAHGEESQGKWRIGRGVVDDLRRKMRYYTSDYIDGVKNSRAISKVISTAIFLIFTTLPTSISYGILNDDNTEGAINVQKVILGQALGGLVFGLFGGQQLLVLSTTAPLSIYISVIYEICISNNWDFYEMSTEEIFSLFIAAALTYKSIRAVIDTYIDSYHECSYSNWKNVSLYMEDGCAPASVLLFVLLVSGTVWLSLLLDSIRTSVYLQRHLREFLSDYALPIAVVINAIIAYFAFYNVDRKNFPIYDGPDMHWIPFYELPGIAHLPAIALAFPLSLLFFMDQLLVTNTVDNKQHNLTKGSSHNWDLLVVALLNIVLSLFGLPWMHASLPSAYLHLKSLSDVEERLHNGSVQQVIVRVRETRLAVLIAHLLMFPVYFFLIPFLNEFIPIALFYGLFFYMAISSLMGNEFWQRIVLIFTDQRAYPPTHYLRRVPQRVVHLFTFIEFVQLCVLCAIGFSGYPYAEVIFPVVIGSYIPLRHYVLPMLFKKEHLDAIDGKH